MLTLSGVLFDRLLYACNSLSLGHSKVALEFAVFLPTAIPNRYPVIGGERRAFKVAISWGFGGVEQ